MVCTWSKGTGMSSLRQVLDLVDAVAERPFQITGSYPKVHTNRLGPLATRALQRRVAKGYRLPEKPQPSMVGVRPGCHRQSRRVRISDRAPWKKDASFPAPATVWAAGAACRRDDVGRGNGGRSGADPCDRRPLGSVDRGEHVHAVVLLRIRGAVLRRHHRSPADDQTRRRLPMEQETLSNMCLGPTVRPATQPGRILRLSL